MVDGRAMFGDGSEGDCHTADSLLGLAAPNAASTPRMVSVSSS